MKNQIWKMYGWLAVAVRDCWPFPFTPTTHAWRAGHTPPWKAACKLAPLFRVVLTSTSINAVVGQTILPPAAYGYSMTSGSELDYVTFDCPDSGPNLFHHQVFYTFGNVYFVHPFLRSFGHREHTLMKPMSLPPAVLVSR